MSPYKITAAEFIVGAAYEIRRHLSDASLCILTYVGCTSPSHFVQHVGTGWIVRPPDPAILSVLDEHGTPWHHRDGSTREAVKP